MGGGGGLGGGGGGGGGGSGGGGGGGGSGGGGGGQPAVSFSLLNENSQEYRAVESEFLSFWPHATHGLIDVGSIEAISNPEREFCFGIIEQDHSVKWAALPQDERPGENTIRLVHGSSYENLRGIAGTGFDLVSSPANGKVYGRGAYLTYASPLACLPHPHNPHPSHPTRSRRSPHQSMVL